MSVKFLLVDDSAVIRLLLRRGLEREQVPPEMILEASNPEGALRSFRSEHPQVVFMDLTLEEPTSPAVSKGPLPPRTVVGGEVVARTMMSEDPLVKIVVCTGAHDSDPRVRELVRLGAFYVMLKPVQVDHIRTFLEILEMDLGVRSAAKRPRSSARERGPPGARR